MLAWTIAAALAAPAAAQPAAPVEAALAPADQVSPGHEPAELDALLAAPDFMTLGKRIAEVSRQADLASDLAWLKARMMEGNSAFVTMLYSRLLWVAVGGMPEEPRHQLRQTAAMATLYAMAAITIDGRRCGDPSAPEHRSQQLMEWNPEIWGFIRALHEAERQQLVDVAVALEASTAARRDAKGDVDFLCRSGMEEMQYNLTHGSAREVKPKPGQIGRQIELSGDGKYKPSQRTEPEWKAQSATLRARLRQDLAGLLAAIQ